MYRRRNPPRSAGPRIYTKYGWVLETLDEDGDIVDSEDYATLNDLLSSAGDDLDESQRVALVKYTVRATPAWPSGEIEDLLSHTYAYVDYGGLEAQFDDGSNVPKTRIAEVARAFR